MEMQYGGGCHDARQMKGASMYFGVSSVATEGERAGQTETVKARHYNMRNIESEER